MNKVRRKNLEKVVELVERARELLEDVIEEEQDAFDNMPEILQYSERGEQMEEYIDSMTDFLDCLDCDCLNDIIGG